MAGAKSKNKIWAVVNASRVRRLKRVGEICRAEEWLWKWCPGWAPRRGQKFYCCTLYFTAGPPMRRIVCSKAAPQLDELIADFNRARLCWELTGKFADSSYFDSVG
jgi:hypothetical protein